MGRIFVIGDVHGCFDMLERLLDRLPFRPEEDRYVFIGDYIDRGPDSYEVVRRVLEIRDAWPETVCLCGNHEVMLLDFLAGKDSGVFLYNGGTDTLASYQEARRRGGWPDVLPSEHEDFLRGLSYYYETEDYIFVHAGLRPGVPLREQDPMDLVWIRREFYASTYDFGKTVVFGHTPFPEPLIRKGRIGIDTGAVYGGKLTCLMLPEVEFYQV